MRIILLLMVVSVFGFHEITPDAFLMFPDLVKKYGYKYENHTAVTEDGHILHVFRVLPKNNPLGKAQPVYLQHGILCTPEAFLAGGAERSLVYYLANRGYDVWVPNSRGSTYSRKHTRYTTDDKEYWDYTFEEQGKFDQRAVIDLIVKVTGSPKVHYWSHSMGGTQMLAALTDEPDYYRQHLYSAILAGPVVTFDLTKSLFIKVMNYTKLPYLMLDLGVNEFFPYLRPLSLLTVYGKSIMGWLITLILKLATDERPEFIDLYNIDVFLANFPASTSTKCFKHLVQLTEHKGFFRYREKSSDPLKYYELYKIPDDIPLAIFIGEHDIVGSPSSMLWFQQQMVKYNKKVHMKMYKNIGHAAFIAPLDMNREFLSDTIKFFENAAYLYHNR